MKTIKIGLRIAVDVIGNKKFCTSEEALGYSCGQFGTVDMDIQEKLLQVVFERTDVSADLAIATAKKFLGNWQQKIIWKTLFAREDINLSQIINVENELRLSNPDYLLDLLEIILLRKDLAPKIVIEKLILEDINFDVIKKREDVQKFFENESTPVEAINYAKKIGDDDLWQKILKRKDVKEYLKP